VWLSSLTEAMKDAFCEEMKIIDYGCGIGRYANFINSRISKFLYIGLEKKGGKNLHGERSIAIAKKSLDFVEISNSVLLIQI
jgi:hypothetical protein